MVNYKLEGDGPLGGTRWTFGANYKNDVWLDTGLNLNTLERRSDAGTVLFAVIAKDFRLARNRVLGVRLNLGNLLDRNYISEGFTFGEKRTYRLATELRF
jgi:hypothetical protein